MKNFLCLFLAFLGAAVAFSTDNVDDNAIGGYTSPKNAIPYLVSLNIGYPFCNGALITKEWVLTAAQCLRRGIRVHLGIYNTDAMEGQKQVIRPHNFIIYPRYNKYTYDNDIMLIKLNRPATINSQVSTISLPTTCPPAGTQCLVSGWGNNTGSNGSTPSLLQCQDTYIFSESSCRNLYPKRITYNMICLRSIGNGDQCSRVEAGSPAVCNGELQGIASWDRESDLRNKVRVYTKVCEYVTWIRDTIRRN